MRTDRVVFAPYGLAGGQPGGRSQNFIEIGNRREPLPGKVTMTVPHNAVIIHEQAGAGGFGDPVARDPGLVREDLLDGKISAAFARRFYGAALDEKS
jgi:N-methylhydantoinase B